MGAPQSYFVNLCIGVTVIESSDPRVCALILTMDLWCVYMQTDNGDAECVENYIADRG